jgi:hypothetical protein
LSIAARDTPALHAHFRWAWPHARTPAVHNSAEDDGMGMKQVPLSQQRRDALVAELRKERPG